ARVVRLARAALGLAQRGADVGAEVGDVVHPGAAVGEELADRRVLPQRPQELDPAVANAHRDRLHALRGNRLAMLDHAAEEPLVHIHRGGEVVHGMADMMDGFRMHLTASQRTRNEGVCMGFLDKLTQQASEVASSVAVKTQEVAKTGQLQVQLRNLNGEERDALVEFGREAFNLHQANALAERSGELAGAAAKITDIRAQIAAKEQEIAAVKSDGAAGDAPSSDTVESSAEEVAEP